MYRCYYCPTESTFSDVVKSLNHTTTHHPHYELETKTRQLDENSGKYVYVTKSFGIVRRQSQQTIVPNEETGSVFIDNDTTSTRDTNDGSISTPTSPVCCVDTDIPTHKVQIISTPKSDTHPKWTVKPTHA
jgi:hypothetical protein